MAAASASARPFLMFQNGQATSAINFYSTTLPLSNIISLEYHNPNEAGAEGLVKFARVVIAGLEVIINDSYVKHAFDFTPSTSLFVDFQDEAEMERVYKALLEGDGLAERGKGTELMPIGNYGFSKRFGWVIDPWGLSWQLNLQ